MEQKQKKRKSRYTILDSVVLIGVIILLYLVFLLIFGGIERITRFGQMGDDEVELSCVIRVEDMDIELYGIDSSFTDDCPFLHVGDLFYMDGKAVGEILTIEYENCMISSGEENGRGELIYATDPYSMNILITLKLTAKESDDGYSVGENTLYVGDQLLFSTKEFEREARICSIDIYEEPDLMPDAVPADVGSVGK